MSPKNKSFEDMLRFRVSESQVAHVLNIIAQPPNKRETALPDDLQGRFDFWFDGGACRMDTGVTTYQFLDGTEALVGAPIAWLSITIRFPDGRGVNIEQEKP